MLKEWNELDSCYVCGKKSSIKVKDIGTGLIMKVCFACKVRVKQQPDLIKECIEMARNKSIKEK